MSLRSCSPSDPRVQRTRQLLQQALEKLLETREFEDISVQDIAEAATLNRATFYDHFSDKSGLLECLVGRRFCELLTQRQVQFDGACTSALQAIVQAVCDYLAKMQGGGGGVTPESRRIPAPHMESAIIAVLRRVLLEGLARHPRPEGVLAPEMVAATAGWAIYGAAREWAHSPDRCASEEVAATVARLVSPILSPPPAHGQPPAAG